MGYRSQWALVVYSEDNEQALADFEVWMTENSLQSNIPFKYFIECKDEHNSHPEKKGFLSYTHDGTKCGDYWDDMITKIATYCEDHGLEWEYARSGDELTDIEKRGECRHDLVCVNVSIEYAF